MRVLERYALTAGVAVRLNRRVCAFGQVLVRNLASLATTPRTIVTSQRLGPAHDAFLLITGSHGHSSRAAARWIVPFRTCYPCVDLLLHPNLCRFASVGGGLLMPHSERQKRQVVVAGPVPVLVMGAFSVRELACPLRCDRHATILRTAPGSGNRFSAGGGFTGPGSIWSS